MTTAPTRIDRDDVAELCLALTGIASPTGDERPLAEWIVQRLQAKGIDAELQVFGETRANVIARRPGTGDGPTLLLYSPIDTAFPLDRAPGAESPAPTETPARAGSGQRIGDWIVGPGAENPKGYATAVLAAFERLCADPARLDGTVVLALAAGGMPTPGRPDRTDAAGLGRGCRELITRIARPDAAVIAKPGDAVSTEEVGIALFRIRVPGDLAYTGSRHRATPRSAILEAARLVEHLEAWFPSWTAAHATEHLAPQGAVTAIAGGWPAAPAFLPDACDVWVDLRIAPGTTLGNAEDALGEAIGATGWDDGTGSTADRPTIELIGGFPGAATPADAWIVRAAIAAWEARSGRTHDEPTAASGVTDASILRAAGIPVARIGMPRPPEPPPVQGFSMGAAHIDGIAALAGTLVDIAIDATSRQRDGTRTDSSAREVNR